MSEDEALIISSAIAGLLAWWTIGVLVIRCKFDALLHKYNYIPPNWRGFFVVMLECLIWPRWLLNWQRPRKLKQRNIFSGR